MVSRKVDNLKDDISFAADRISEAKKVREELNIHIQEARIDTQPITEHSDLQDELKELRSQHETLAKEITNLNNKNNEAKKALDDAGKAAKCLGDVITLLRNSSINMSKTLLWMLEFEMLSKGHGKGLRNSGSGVLYFQTSRAVDLSSDVNSLCIYSNMVEYEYVGDVMAPLLRIVHMDDTDGVRVTKTYPQSFYRPVSLRYIDTIEIDIKDMYRRPIQFSEGDVVVNKLHFRRHQPLRYSK